MKLTSLSFIGFVIVAGASVLAFAKALDDSEAGKKAEQTACLPCHSLRLIDSQRLSAEAWQKEVDKMIGWGAVVPNRQLLIDYLNQHYSNTQAPPLAVRSADSK